MRDQITLYPEPRTTVVELRPDAAWRAALALVVWEWEGKLSPYEYERRALARRRAHDRPDRIGAGTVVVMVAGAVLWAYIILATVWGVMR